MSNDEPRSYRLIVSLTLVPLLRERIENFHAILSSLENEGVLRHFPDDSIMIEGDIAVNEFYEYYKHRLPGETYSLSHYIHKGGFRALAPFPQDMSYLLHFPNAYNDSLGNNWFVAGMTAAEDAVPSEWKLDDLTVTTCPQTGQEAGSHGRLRSRQFGSQKVPLKSLAY
jgi:hypothetical protein